MQKKVAQPLCLGIAQETPSPLRWALCRMGLGTHQEAPRQGAEPLEGVLRGVSAQPSLDGDLGAVGTGSHCPSRTKRQRYQSCPCSLVAHHDQDLLPQLPVTAAASRARDRPHRPPAAPPTCPHQPQEVTGLKPPHTWLWTGAMQVSPPAVKLQKATSASWGLPWLGSMWYCPGGRQRAAPSTRVLAWG